MLSIVIPIFNEAETLELLHQELSSVLNEHCRSSELILVDDGSSDGSWRKIVALAAVDQRVKGVRLRRNFGKAAALKAGFAEASGETILTLDADLQDDPLEIPRFLDKLNAGYDLVIGWKKQRNDPWHKVYPSKIFNGIVGLLTGLKLHDHNCGFKAMRREVVEELNLYGELHRFITVMAHSNGFRIAEIHVNHRPRRHGQSKYGVRRFLHGFLDLVTIHFLTGYRDRPLHLLGLFGMVSAIVGLFGLGYLAALWLLGEGIGSRPLLTYSLAFLLLGAQLFNFGILAEICIFNSRGTRGSLKAPSIADRTWIQ